jgi:hypothetical protein
MQKSTLTKIVLVLLAVAVAGVVLYKCGGSFKEGMEDAKEHREAGR